MPPKQRKTLRSYNYNYETQSPAKLVPESLSQGVQVVEEQLLMVPQTRKVKNPNLMIDLTGKRSLADDMSSNRSSVLQSQLSNYMAALMPGQRRSKSKKKKKKSQSPTLRSNSSISFSDSRSL